MRDRCWQRTKTSCIGIHIRGTQDKESAKKLETRDREFKQEKKKSEKLATEEIKTRYARQETKNQTLSVATMKMGKTYAKNKGNYKRSSKYKQITNQ